MIVEVQGTVSKQKPPRKLTMKDGRVAWAIAVNVKDSSELGACLVSAFIDHPVEPGAEVRLLLDIPNDAARVLECSSIVPKKSG